MVLGLIKVDTGDVPVQQPIPVRPVSLEGVKPMKPVTSLRIPQVQDSVKNEVPSGYLENINEMVKPFLCHFHGKA